MSRDELAVDEMEGALVVARWAPAGREGLVEGGAWGWALAKDWGPDRMGFEAWLSAKEQCARRAPTHHVAAVEDALGCMIDRACEAGSAGGMMVLSVEIRGMGPPQSRRVEVLCSYRRGEGSQSRAELAVAAFFDGVPSGARSWAERGDDGSNSFAMRAELSHVRQAWMERAELEAQGGEATASGRTGRI